MPLHLCTLFTMSSNVRNLGVALRDGVELISPKPAIVEARCLYIYVHDIFDIALVFLNWICLQFMLYVELSMFAWL